MTTRILFVDDDEYLLAAMRRLVWNYDEEWECEFADSGTSALAILADSEFDVIVSDMRMPGMDGAEFLANARLLCPETIRIVLSGQSDREYAFHAMGPIQQFLSKPCNAAELKRVISRAMGLKEFLSLDSDCANHSGGELLGAFPSLAARVHKAFEGQMTPASAIESAALATADLTDLVLFAANTSKKNSVGSCRDVGEVISLLGTEATRALVFAVAIYSEVARDVDTAKRTLKQVSRSAVLAREITKVETGSCEMADQAMLGALLKGLADLPAFRDGTGNQRDASVVAATVLQHWGFAIPVVEAVAFHKCPQAVVDEGFSPLAAVYVAERICAHGTEVQSSDTFVDSIGLGDRYPLWMEFAESR